MALLDCAAVDDVVDLVFADAEEVQQRAALGRSTVNCDSLAV